MKRARGFLKRIIKTIQKTEMRILPGQLAFFIFMSFIPIAILIGALAGIFNITANEIKLVIGASIPKAVVNTLVNLLGNKRISLETILFLIIAFLIASNGAHSIIITSNEIYKIKSRNLLSRRVKAIFLTFILVLLLSVLLLGPVFGDQIFSIISANISDKSYVDFIHKIYELVKYPAILGIIYINIKIIYILAPDTKVESLSTSRGAIFTTILWVLASDVFAVYASRAAYDELYGSASAIVVTMVWIYIISYIFVLGMAINAGIDREENKEEK